MLFTSARVIFEQLGWHGGDAKSGPSLHRPDVGQPESVLQHIIFFHSCSVRDTTKDKDSSVEINYLAVASRNDGIGTEQGLTGGEAILGGEH